MKKSTRCRLCKRAFIYYTTKTRGKFCSKRCQHKMPAAGCIWLGKNGYLYIQFGRSGKKQLLHRLIAGAKKGQVVHHRDGDPMNNDPDNLEILRGQSDHIKIHNPVLARWKRVRKAGWKPKREKN